MKSIAIDGPAASGKTTVGKELASQIGYAFLDTGLMYRAITLWALDAQVNLCDKKSLSELAVQKASQAGDLALTGGNESLRTETIGKHVSTVARLPEVRNPLVERQRFIAADRPIVMVGRDVGTVVLPDSFKVYLEASHEVRTERRLKELLEKGRSENLASAGYEIELRDEMDSERSASPLKAALGSLKIQTDNLDVLMAVQLIIKALNDAE